MADRLPPLKSIEAFVAVAQTLSFSKAALELNITKSAVSRRIQVLEADLGTRLLSRNPSAVKLTDSGQTYFDLTSAVFADLHRATTALDLAKTRSVLRISVPESFASVWLVPRLSSFYKKNYEIELHLDSRSYYEQLDLRDVDVGIRVSRTPPGAHHAERFMTLTQFPVCSPDLIAQSPITAIDDLNDRTIIVLTTMADAWDDWLRQAGRSDIRPQNVLAFDTMSLVMKAATSGLGIAMGIGELGKSELDEGRLVAPFEPRLAGAYSLFFVCRRQDVSRRAVLRFRNWLIAEADAT
jgi:LysR family glycine cleavage system transcriptional activator